MKKDSYNFLRKIVFTMCIAVFGAALSFAQKTVTGTITDSESGEPLIGANVIIKGTATGTVTDIDGVFSLEVADSDILVITYTGYASYEATVGAQTILDITLSAGAFLDEVVVTGYGTALKRDLTGSVAVLDNDDFNKGLIVSADQLIQGLAAGVQVLNNSGQPGGQTTVRIRGNNSIRLGSGPLYVLDGVPLSGASARPDLDVQGLGGAPGSNPLNFLNPTDIESMTILKDASAAAIYGSRAANGVILITTKKGRNAKPQIDFSSSIGFSSVLSNYEVLDAGAYRTALSDYGLGSNGDYGSDVDALDEITRSGLINNHAFSINGGSDRGSYRISAGYYKQEGVVKNNDLQRVNANFRGNYDFLENDRFTVDVNLIASQTNENVAPISTNSGFQGSLIGNALQWNPTHPLYESDGSPVIVPEFGNFTNPVALLDAYKDNAQTFDVFASIAPSVKILDNLTYRFMYSIAHSRGERRASIAPWINVEGVQGRGVAYLYNKTVTSQILNHTLTWDVDLSPTIGLVALAGYEYQKFEERLHNQSAFDFPDTDIDFTNIMQFGSAGSREIASSAPPVAEIQSYFARLAFNFNDRFLLTGTIRSDGSSKFGENNKYGYFPAAAAAWNLHNEGFASGGLFNSLKLRAGFGITGNQDFPSGASRDRYALLADGTAEQTNVGNPDLKWETTTTFNAAVDFAIWNYRLTGTLEYFNRNTTDLLFQLTPSQPAPATLYWVNLDGEVVNSGFEMQFNGLVVDQPDFKWDIGLNLTFMTNELRNYTGPNFAYGTLFGQGISGATVHRLDSDQPLNAFYVRDWVGLNNEGFDQFRDADGNIVDNTQFASYLGDPNPSTLLGISTNLSFKKLSLGLNFNGAMGQDIYNNTKNTVTPIGNLGSRNIDATLVGNDIRENTANSVKSSTRYLESGNYVKLANATLSYDIGDIGSGVRNARVYISGSNLMLFTGYKGFDPEVNTINDAEGLPSAGIDYIPYPSARSIIFGINFSL